MTRVAIYAGSFDPVTNGHLDVIRRGVALFDEVVVAIGHNPRKSRTLSLEDRLALLRDTCADLPAVRVTHFEGLLVDHARAIGACAILRGLRAVTDFEFEFQTGLANMDLAPDIETVFLLTEPRNIFVSSSIVKEVAVNGGDISRWVPARVAEVLLARLRG